MSNLSSSSRTLETCGRVLVMDDDPLVRRFVTQALGPTGYVIIEARDAHEVRAQLDSGGIDVVLIATHLADPAAAQLIPELGKRRPHVPAIVMTSSERRADMLDAMRLGASGYLRKPVDPVALEAQVSISLAASRRLREQRLERSRFDAQLEHAQEALSDVALQLAKQFTGAWDLRHVETGAHVRRIARFTEILARALGESELDARNLAHAAMLHDVGKIMIPDAILAKPGPLTPAEFEIMKTHPVLGARLLEGISHPLVELACNVALYHHERWNGSGYPRGLVGAQCPREASVVAMVDVYDALSQARCYKPAWEEARIVAHFRAESGTLYEASLTQVLLDCLPELRAAGEAFSDSADWALAPSGTWLKSGSFAAESPAALRSRAKPV